MKFMKRNSSFQKKGDKEIIIKIILIFLITI